MQGNPAEKFAAAGEGNQRIQQTESIATERNPEPKYGHISR